MANSRSEVKGKSLEAGKLQAGGKREGGKTLAQWGQREEGEEEETKVDAQGQRPKRRWTDGRKNSGPIFL